MYDLQRQSHIQEPAHPTMSLLQFALVQRLFAQCVRVRDEDAGGICGLGDR